MRPCMWLISVLAAGPRGGWVGVAQRDKAPADAPDEAQPGPATFRVFLVGSHGDFDAE